jgi:peptidyl-prolyl cis-trans isomerase SurA
MNSFHTKQIGTTMIPNSKLKVFLLCAAFCVQQGALAQTAAGTVPSAAPVASPAPAAVPATAPAVAPAASTPATSAPAPVKERVPTQLADSIVVVVNDDVITKNELADRMAFVERSMKAQGISAPPAAEFRKQVLERMIIDRAQLQLAKEDGIRVDDVMLDRYISRIAESNKMNMQQFRDQVERDGTAYPKFREQIRDEIMMQRVREHEVENKLQITESEVDNYLAAQSGAGAGQQELDLAQILIGIPENASAEQIAARRAKAEDILRQLKSGADFGKLAATYSDSSTDALKGGDLGWRNQDRLPQLFLDAVAKLHEGEVSSIVKSANGFHIIKLVGKRTASIMRGGGPTAPPAVQQTHVRHILIKVNQVVTAAEARRKLLELKDRLNNKAATFEDLAKLYSNDSSASKGGDIGWVYPGDTAPEFEQAMNSLPPGGISDPVQTSLGYHLIQVVERKSDDLSKERQRLLARQAIRERKLDEATQDWLRTTRDRAYVEFRSDDK